MSFITDIVIGIPALYMAIVVPIGYVVGVDNIKGHTHYLYYTEVDGNTTLSGYNHVKNIKMIQA